MFIFKFGGYKQSGHGRELGEDGIYFFSYLLTIDSHMSLFALCFIFIQGLDHYLETKTILVKLPTKN